MIRPAGGDTPTGHQEQNKLLTNNLKKREL